MRILTIRGENLASLAGPFEVDLTAEPLAGTGLFAITGPTGAGKSTILDCVCLALYGRFPRATGGRDEKVPDQGEETLQASDPRTILRRQAASAFAEVDFIGSDGVGYRARWSVRRARDRASGSLQKAAHVLTRLDDGTAIATGLRDTEPAVVQRTGLSYDQFRRTVLLAQGEFDALLLADEAQRAELLEKITGTRLYSQISIEAHRAATERAHALALLEARRQAMAVLAPEAIEALVRDAEVTGRDLAAARDDADRLDVRLRHDEALAAAGAALAEAERAHAGAIGQSEAGEPLRRRAALLAAVEPLRAMVERIRALEVAAASARTVAEHAREAAAHAATGRDAATALETTARTAAVDCATQVARWTPVWTEAAALDSRLEALCDEEKRAEAAAAAARHDHEGVSATVAHAQREYDVAEAQLARTAVMLQAVAPHERLATDWERTRQTLERHRATHTELGEARARLDTLVGAIAEADHRIQSIGSRIAAATERRQRLAGAIERDRARLQGLDLRALTTRATQLAEARRLSAETTAQFERLFAARGRAREADAAAIELEAAWREAVTAQSRLAVDLDRDRAARAEAQPLADLAEATLSARATALRATLASGAPCPVCGALDHPWDTDAPARALAIEIRERRRQLDRRIGDGEAALGQIAADVARAEAGRSEAERQRAAASADAGAADASLRRLVPALVGAVSACGLGVAVALWTGAAARLEGGDAAGIAEALETTREAVEAGLDTVVLTRTQADDLTAELAQSHTALGRIDEEAEADRTSRDDAERQRARLDADRAALAAGVTSLAGQLDHLARDLAPALAAAGRSPVDLDGDGDSHGALASHLRGLAEKWRRLDQEHRQLQAHAPARATAVREAEVRLEAAVGTLAAARTMLEQRQAASSTLAGARARLLGGQSTGSHRIQTLARRDEAEAQARSALAVVTEAHRTHADREAEAAARARAHTDAVLARDQDRAALDRDLDRLGETHATVVTLLELAPDERRRLAADVQRFDQAVVAAKSLVQTRRGDLDVLVRCRPDDQSELASGETIAARLEARHADVDRLASSLAGIRRDLETDALRRAEATAVDREIEAARADLAVWSAVNEAIGQADGAKFRRFAQGLTLRHLTALANRQLASLGPRYRLRVGTTTSLALEIVDSDMGDEVRGPRSLSGGERFLVSLALALALARLDGGQAFVDTLFIDEGFGALDRETLDMAIATLEALHGHGRKVGVVTHVAAMIERIPVQIHVAKRGNGRSTIAVRSRADGS